MTPELAKKLYDKHGAVFKFEKTDPASPTNFFMFGIECGDGWYDILNHLLFCISAHQKDAKKHNPDYVDIEIQQIKEKFGTLRFYYSGGDDYIEGLVRLAEAMTETTCEVCGNKGKYTDTGWIRTLCDEHAKNES